MLRAVLESPSDIVIFALDREYRYLAFNQNHATTIKAIWGVDIRIGSPMLEIIGRPDDRDKASVTSTAPSRVRTSRSAKNMATSGCSV